MAFSPWLFLQKKTIVTVRLGSKYASVTINLILTSATQLYSKTTKVNEMFIVTLHFFLILVQKLRNSKSLIFRKSSFTAHKDKFMSNESPTQAFWLVPNVTNAQKRVPRYPTPWNLIPRAVFKKQMLFRLPLMAKVCAGNNVAQPWSRDSEIISLIYCKFYSRWRGLGWASQITDKMMEFCYVVLGISQC